MHGLAENRLRVDGQRYTGNRRTLVEVLEQADGPVSLPQLLQRGRRLAQSSAYRNLGVLEAAGVVHRIITTDGFARFELGQDLTEHHHHRVCTACGNVDDFTLPAALETALEKALRHVATKAEFQVSSHQLDLIGLCVGCR